MGYTHYWHNAPKLNKASWDKFSKVVEALIDGCDISLRYEADTDKDPVVNSRYIRFNGPWEDGHETFLFERINSSGYIEKEGEFAGKAFSWCKTARKEYDTVVVAVLILAVHFFPGEVVFKSDGNEADFVAGKELADRFLKESSVI